MLVLVSCGGGGGSSGPDATDNAAGTDAVAETTTNADTPPEAVIVSEDFRAVYWYKGRTTGSNGNEGKGLLRMLDPRDKDPTNDETLSDGLTALGMDCNLGCYVDSNLKWLAVARGAGDQGNFTLSLLAIGAGRTLSSLGVADVEGVTHLEFLGDQVYFSKQLETCASSTDLTVRCYDIYRVNLNSPAAPEQVLTFPPDDALTGSSYQGNFRAGEDQQTLLFVLPFHASKRIYTFKDQTLKAVGADLCTGHDTDGNCTGGSSGSVYQDADPVALSKDGRTLVFTALEDNQELRLFVHDMETDTRRYSVILKVPSNYLLNACYNRATWQYTTILPPIRFTANGGDVILLGSAECDANKDKAWTNIFRLPLLRIGSGDVLTEADYLMVTSNPTGKTSACVTISTFDLSPTGDNVVFLGTPRLQEDGSPIPDASPRHFTDSEVYVTRTDGSAIPVQVTNSTSWKASALTAVKTPQ